MFTRGRRRAKYRSPDSRTLANDNFKHWEWNHSPWNTVCLNVVEAWKLLSSSDTWRIFGLLFFFFPPPPPPSGVYALSALCDDRIKKEKKKEKRKKRRRKKKKREKRRGGRIALVCEMIQSVLFPAFWKGLFAKRTQCLWVSLLSGINHFEHGPKRETSVMYFGGHTPPWKTTEYWTRRMLSSTRTWKGTWQPWESASLC